MSSNNDEVTVIGPNGERKRMPRTAAECPDVRVMGFQIINEIDYGIKAVGAPAEDGEQAAPATRGRKPKAPVTNAD